MRRASISVLAAPLVAAAALCACSVLVDTSGLSGGAEPTNDGAPVDAGGFDARGSDDGTATGDAPIDAASVDAADASPPCVDSATRFCDDFDQSNPGAKWTDRTTHRGQMAYSDGSLSPPHALHASIHGGPGNGIASLSETFAAVPSKIRCEIDVKLDVVPSSGELDLLNITTSGSDPGHTIYIAIFDGQWAVAEYQDAPDGGTLIDRQMDLGVDLPLGTWFHAVLDTSRTSATLTANGTTATLSSLSVPSSGTSRAVTAGINYTSASVQAGSVFIDNVDCITQP